MYMSINDATFHNVTHLRIYVDAGDEQFYFYFIVPWNNNSDIPILDATLKLDKCETDNTHTQQNKTY